MVRGLVLLSILKPIWQKVHQGVKLRHTSTCNELVLQPKHKKAEIDTMPGAYYRVQTIQHAW